MDINKNSIIQLKLVAQKLNSEKYVVGNLKTNIFLEVPDEFMYILEFSNGSMSIKDIEDKIFQKYDVSIDVYDAITFLYEQNLIYSIDGNIIGDDNNIEYNRVIKRVANFVFQKKMCYFYSILFVFNFFIIISNSNYFPKSSSAAIILDKPGLSLLVFLLISWLITAWHETGHFLAAVKLNIPVNIKLNLRICFLVIESDINGIWSIDKKSRYVCYLAGFFAENFLLFFVIICRILFSESFFIIQISNAIILIVFLNFIWQFMIFLRTDFYLILLNYFGISSLHNSAIEYLKSKAKNKIKDKRVFAYLIIYLVGFIISIIFYMYNISIYYNLISISISQLKNQTGNIIDNIILIILMLVNAGIWCIAGFNKIKEVRRK